MKATIQKVILQQINDIWKKHKPQGLGFSDTDAVIIALKTKEGQKFTETFYCRLKGDGTLGHSITKASEKRQQNLWKFIKKYISKEKEYNVRENIGKWEEREVDVEELDNGYTIRL